MKKRVVKDIYNTEKVYQYSIICNVKFIEIRTINGREHVVMNDKFGREKVVYKELYDKHVKIMEPTNERK